MHLAKLTAATILHRKVWVIWVVLLGTGAWIFPYLTPFEQDITLIEPARAQAAWMLLWLAALTWGLFQGAGFGESLAKRGLGEYFASMGVSRLSQLMQIWAACLAYILPLLLLALVICLVWTRPAHPEEARMWTFTLLQYSLLFTLVFSSLLALVIGLATRIGAATAYLVGAGLALYGLYGVGFLDLLFEVQTNALLETLWTFSPHFHLGNLTDRLIFKSGHLAAGDFLQITAYLSGLFLLHILISYLFFNPVRLRR